MGNLRHTIPKHHEAAAGIYRIRNLKTEEIYIGSTTSFLQRWYRHNYGLIKHCHFNYKLTKAGHDHGFRNLCFEIVEIVEDVSKLIEREQYYIDSLKPVYNIRKKADWKPKRKRRKWASKRKTLPKRK